MNDSPNNHERSGIVFATPDLPLREDVRRLGAMVGELLAEQVSADFLAEVEQVRTAAIARRENRQPLSALSTQLAGRTPQQAETMVRAFATYFQVVNIAERVHRIRRRRDYQRAGSKRPQPESLADALGQLKAQGVSVEELAQCLEHIDIEPVFTAHPTEAVRRALLEKEQVMVASLVEHLDGLRTPHEQIADTARFRKALTAAWQTNDSSPIRPGVEDEREHIGFYLAGVLYRVIPVFYEALEQALIDTWGRSLPLPRLLRFGTWVGGDMDGNPNVDAHTLSATLQAQRQMVLELYLKDLVELASLLSQSIERVGISEAVLARIDDYQKLLPNVQSRPRHADMPYRLLNDRMRARLQATLDDSHGAYSGPEEFIDDLHLILDSLEANKGKYAGAFSVRRLLWRVRTFGFHLARLDVRQESSIHTRALMEVLDQPIDTLDNTARAQYLAPYAAGTIALPAATQETGIRLDQVFSALAAARGRHGSEAIGSYIISMAREPADVLAVLALARRGGLLDETNAVPLDIAPLFETVDDLQHSITTLQRLLNDPVYRAHLAARGHRQMVMLGYSDSGKDSGIAASRWALQKAQRQLRAVADDYGVQLTFFHGRGGSISRGGTKTTHAVDASPLGAIAGRLRVTEQGEVIHRKYGIRALALRSLEQTTGAVLRASLRPRTLDARVDRWRALMEHIAAESATAYRALVGHKHFMDYFRQATPVDVIERMTLGSRPSRRLGTDAALSNLRAIPWVFAWSQARAMVPGWFGLGSGLQAAADAGQEDTLREMAHAWPFFDIFLDDVAMVLSKGDVSIAEQFSQLSGELHAVFFPVIRQELALTIRWLKRLNGQNELLDHDPRLALSIRLRNPYIDPISLLQLDLLQRWRASGREDEHLLRALVACVNGVAQGIQNTG